MPSQLILICGPTATGKTRLGVALAKALGGEVVSADSMQVYRDLVIGTARPTQEEMAGVPHHMMGVADPRENYSVARYVQEATACVEDIFRRGRQPIVVGGTGLYLDALCQGRSFSDFRPETGVRTRLQAQAAQGGLDALWEQLRQVDPGRDRVDPAGSGNGLQRGCDLWRHSQGVSRRRPKRGWRCYPGPGAGDAPAGLWRSA